MFRETARNISINQRTNLAGPAHIIISEKNRVAVATLKFALENRCKEMASAICDIKWGRCRRNREDRGRERGGGRGRKIALVSIKRRLKIVPSSLR